uniref:Uncharacterized protein n=1 Tax=Anopheles atroparvus TaxID=41427 RepID=A0A182J2I2_ANOAO
MASEKVGNSFRVLGANDGLGRKPQASSYQITHTFSTFLSSLCSALVLVGMLCGSQGAYQAVPSQENDFHHGLKIVHPTEPTGDYPHSSQEASFYQQHPADYQHLSQAHQQQPVSAEQHLVHFPPQGHEYLVQSGYNVGPHQPGQVVHHEEQQEPQQPQQQQHLKQRQTALPYNHERLHVKIEYPGAGHGIARPSAAAHPTAHEPKQDYRAAIPKSIAPKLNPLHHSFHQNRNFVPLHHITRQVPVPAGRHGQVQPHSQQQQQHPVKAALAAPPPQHIAGYDAPVFYGLYADSAEEHEFILRITTRDAILREFSTHQHAV